MYILYRLLKNQRFIWFLCLSVIALLLIAVHYETVYDIITSPTVTKRMEIHTVMKNIKLRIFDKLVFFEDWQVLLGCAQGAKMRFWDDNEIHNVFGLMFRSYGVIGLLLFLMWITKVIVSTGRRLEGGLAIWSALIFYNSFLVGTRFRSFWILVALMIVMARFLELNQANFKRSAVVAYATDPFMESADRLLGAKT